MFYLSSLYNINTHNMRKTLLIILTAWSAMPAQAQKLFHSYYDYNHTKVKEEYSADGYGVKNGSYKLYSEYGGVLVSGTYKNDKMVGEWVTKDEKGVLTADENYDQDGNFNGACNYYQSGHEQRVEHYSHGHKTGNWKTWYSTDDGENAYNQLHYDEYYKNGKLDSVYSEWAIDGKPIKKCIYKDGLLNGLDEEYRGGILIIKKHFVTDTLNGEATFYDINGSGDVMASGSYKNGWYVGKWKFTFDAGFNETEDKSKAQYYRLVDCTGKFWLATDFYITGEVQGKETLTHIFPDAYVGHFATFYKNGKINEVSRFDENGKLDSVDNHYYESGQMSGTSLYVHGALNSAYTLFFEDGKTWVQGNCKDNCRVSKWSIYDKNGTVVFMEDYSEQHQEDYGTVVEAFMHFYKDGKEVFSQRDGDDFGTESAVKPPCVWPWPTKAIMSMIDEHSK